MKSELANFAPDKKWWVGRWSGFLSIPPQNVRFILYTLLFPSNFPIQKTADFGLSSASWVQSSFHSGTSQIIEIATHLSLSLKALAIYGKIDASCHLNQVFFGDHEMSTFRSFCPGRWMAKGDIFTGRLPKRPAKGRDRSSKTTGERGVCVCGGIHFFRVRVKWGFTTPCFWWRKKVVNIKQIVVKGCFNTPLEHPPKPLRKG